MIEEVAALVATQLEGDGAALAERFIRVYYAHVSPDDMAEDTPENLLGAALSLWRFSIRREAGKAKVRIYVPRLEEHGWESGHTVLEIVNDDMPFLVDSVTAALIERGLTVDLISHPVIRVRRDGKGEIFDLIGNDRDPGAGCKESFMHVEIDGHFSAREMEETRADVESVLGHVRAAVEDWKAMRDKVGDILEEMEKVPPGVAKEDAEVARDFLRWIVDDHFTFLGYRAYEFTGRDEAVMGTVIEDTGLGILRHRGFTIFHPAGTASSLPPDMRQLIRQPTLLLISKANRKSPVHRAVHMDTIGIKSFDGKGRVVGEHRFVGLFTSHAYNVSPRPSRYSGRSSTAR